MTPERTAAYIGGGILLAAWLTSAAAVTQQPRVGPAPRPTPESVQLDALASEVQSQATRLRQRLASAPAPQVPIRNPFVFSSRRAEVRPAAARPLAAPPMETALPAPIEPDLVLLGVAEQDGIRTAMMAAGDELLMVTAGQPVGGRYSVSAVGPDDVELKELVTGVTRRLALKPPASPQ
ncbi:MAG: hypothetical protein ABI818_18730 [Acidobacteriota bacterium]